MRKKKEGERGARIKRKKRARVIMHAASTKKKKKNVNEYVARHYVILLGSPDPSEGMRKSRKYKSTPRRAFRLLNLILMLFFFYSNHRMKNL